MSDDNRERAKREGWASPSNALPPHVLAMPPERVFEFFHAGEPKVGDSIELTVAPTAESFGVQPFRLTIKDRGDHACACPYHEPPAPRRRFWRSR